MAHKEKNVPHHNALATLPNKQSVFVWAVNLICVALAYELGGLH